MMDENFKDSLNIYAAACLTFGYDKGLAYDKYEKYVDMLCDANISPYKLSLFGREYSLLNSGVKNAIVGLRSKKLNSIIGDSIRKEYLNKLFILIPKEIICDYACSFLKKRGFKDINTKSISSEYMQILKLIGLKSQEIPKNSLDDSEIKTSKNKKENDIEGIFSQKLLKKVNIDKILSCDKIYVQFMDSLEGIKLEPLDDKELEELRGLCFYYSTNGYRFMNKLLRGGIKTFYDDSKLEKKIKAYNKKLNEAEKYLKIYENPTNSNSLILPLDIYSKIKDTCRDLSKLIKQKKLNEGSVWRLMDTVGLKEMLVKKIMGRYIISDKQIKENLKNGNLGFIRSMESILVGQQIMDRAFLSTSFSNGIEFTDGLSRQAIVLKIKANNLPGMLLGDFAHFKKEKEFLLPPKTKLKIISISEYNGIANKSKAEKECIQINCVNV